MSLNPKQRRIALGIALALTLGAVIWVDEADKDNEVAPVSAVTRTAKAARASEPMHVDLSKLEQRQADAGQEIGNVFEAKSWYVPPPPPKPVPPPPPSPPPLPFTYLGKMLEDGKLTVFLTKQDRHYAVRAGDTLDGTYRIVELDAQRMILTYLPLNMQQTLMMGGAGQ